MEDLRWLLLIFGLLAIAGVYLYSRKEKKASDAKPASTDRVEPSLDGSEQDDELPRDSEDHINDASVEDPDDEPTQQESPQKIVTVRIVAHEQASFAGDELVLSMRGIGLQHGEFGIFHRLDGNEEGRTIFSAASLIEPGSFDLQNIKGQEIPGISLFLVLPGPVECIEAFDMMLAAARILTQSLNGELLDESGSTLSTQRERYLREEIIQFQHSNLVA
jgi:cell division protein ZipA|tara:strand:- start:1544 stop:2200 length:657 start_codon:yes stop_codon:yes gene_type:complete